MGEASMAGSWNWKSHTFVPSAASSAYRAASDADVEMTKTRPPLTAGAVKDEKAERVRVAHLVPAVPRDDRLTARTRCSPPRPKKACPSARVAAVASPTTPLPVAKLHWSRPVVASIEVTASDPVACCAETTTTDVPDTAGGASIDPAA